MSRTADTRARPGPTTDVEADAQQALQRVLAGWNAAARDWNVEALAAMYTADTVMFGGLPGHSIGIDGMRRYFGAYVGQLAGAELDLVDQHILQVGDDSILAQGFGVFGFQRVDGRRTGTTMRTSWLLQRQAGGDWRIRQHHFSTIPDKPPIDG
ncbi:MAG: SgcJ/EcaC family oxidoreductase [Variovorax sp.]